MAAADVEKAVAAIEALGYDHRGEMGIEGRHRMRCASTITTKKLTHSVWCWCESFEEVLYCNSIFHCPSFQLITWAMADAVAQVTDSWDLGWKNFLPGSCLAKQACNKGHLHVTHYLICQFVRS